jgi:glycosyltransferase involved in cell wall biosynthesis
LSRVKLVGANPGGNGSGKGKLVRVNLDTLPLVVVGMPFYKSIPHPNILLRAHLQSTGIPGYRTVIRDLPSTIIVMARNDALEEIVGHRWDYLFFIDDDIGFPAAEMYEQTLVKGADGKDYQVSKVVALMKRILDNNLNICGGLYCQRGAPHMPLAFKKYTKDGAETYVWIVEPPTDGIEEVDAVATGFLCFKREVIDSFKQREAERIELRRRYLDWRQGAEADGTYRTLPAVLRDYLDISRADITPPFWIDYNYDPVKGTWSHVGEDIYFCREAQKLGYKIHVDWGVQLGHQRESFITPNGYRHAFMDEAKKKQQEIWDKINKQDSTAEDTAAKLKAAGLVPAAEAEVASG